MNDDFLSRVAKDLAGTRRVLVVGRTDAKGELMTFIKRTMPKLARGLSGIETVDHASDETLIALGLSFFEANDRASVQLHR